MQKVQTVVRTPRIPDTARNSAQEYIFNAVGFYEDLNARLDEQKEQVLAVLWRLQNGERTPEESYRR
jgi:hypothetical protein